MASKVFKCNNCKLRSSDVNLFFTRTQCLACKKRHHADFMIRWRRKHRRKLQKRKKELYKLKKKFKAKRKDTKERKKRVVQLRQSKGTKISPAEKIELQKAKYRFKKELLRKTQNKVIVKHVHTIIVNEPKPVIKLPKPVKRWKPSRKRVRIINVIDRPKKKYIYKKRFVSKLNKLVKILTKGPITLKNRKVYKAPVNPLISVDENTFA